MQKLHLVHVLTSFSSSFSSFQIFFLFRIREITLKIHCHVLRSQPIVTDLDTMCVRWMDKVCVSEPNRVTGILSSRRSCFNCAFSVCTQTKRRKYTILFARREFNRCDVACVCVLACCFTHTCTESCCCICDRQLSSQSFENCGLNVCARL